MQCGSKIRLGCLSQIKFKSRNCSIILIDDNDNGDHDDGDDNGENDDGDGNEEDSDAARVEKCWLIPFLGNRGQLMTLGRLYSREAKEPTRKLSWHGTSAHRWC